jgi:MFS family permease
MANSSLDGMSIKTLGYAPPTSKPADCHNCYGGAPYCRDAPPHPFSAQKQGRGTWEANMSSVIGSEAVAGNPGLDGGLTREQQKNLTLASLGSMLEFYEFMVFGFLTVVIARQFFPALIPDSVKTFQAFAIFTLGFLLRPLSGAVLGHLGDRLGRKKLFLFTVFAMAVPTILMGLLPSYAQIGIAAPIALLVLRLAQGIAIAGEFAGAAVFVSEHVLGSRVGYALGWMMCGSYLGFFLGAAMAAFLSNTLDPAALDAWGWRVAFIVGGIFGLVAVYLRRALDETPLFKEIVQIKGASTTFLLLDVTRYHLKPILFVTGCGAYLGIMVLIVYFYMPTSLQVQYGFARDTVFNANAAALLMLAVMCPAWGWIADRIGAAMTLGIGAAGASAVVFLFFQNIDSVASDPTQLMWWCVGWSAFMGTAVAVAMFSALSFPTEVRFFGFGLCYNLGIVISGVTPTLLAWLVVAYDKTSVAYLVVANGMVGIVLALIATRIKQYPRER